MPDHQPLRWLLIFALILLLLPAGQALVCGNDSGRSDACLAVCRALRLKLMIMALICCLLPAIIATASWADFDNRAIVVLRIDDCSPSWNTPYVGLEGMTGLSYGKLKHIPITWGIITSVASSGQSLTWARLKDYLDTAGGEPASHSVNHSPMSTQQDYINEIVNSKIAIQANLPGYACNTFIQPGVWQGDASMDSFAKLDNPIGQAIQANYAQSMAYLGMLYGVGNAYYKYGTTEVFAIDAGGLTIPIPTIPDSIGSMNTVLDIAAATPGLVMVISGHGVLEQGQAVAYNIPADILKATMDKLADLRDQNKIRLMSLNDAFNATFSPGLNRTPDAGFEVCNPGVINVPWRAYGTAQMVSPGGVDDSRYCSLPDGSSRIASSYLTLPPGRYEMTWYQKAINGKPNYGLAVAFSAMGPNFVGPRGCLDWASFSNSSPITDWQKKTALVLVPDRLNSSQFTFMPVAGSGYGVDNVSVVSAPIDPAVSPSASVVTPSLGLCTISWHTPNDPLVTAVTVRYNANTHPLTPTSLTLLCTVAAQPNAVQQISVPLDWTHYNDAFFSVFGIRDGSFTPPDLVSVKVDRTPPTMPNVTLAIDPDTTLHAYWSSSDPDSGVVQYQYAVGSSPGNDSIKHWTLTSGTSATTPAGPGGATIYVSVKAQNTYGFWSDVGSAHTSLPMTISLACTLSDGQLVSISGTVTAVFRDCCYIENTDRSRAMKVTGNISSFNQGDYVSVSGSLATRNGERYVTIP